MSHQQVKMTAVLSGHPSIYFLTLSSPLLIQVAPRAVLVELIRDLYFVPDKRFELYITGNWIKEARAIKLR